MACTVPCRLLIRDNRISCRRFPLPAVDGFISIALYVFERTPGAVSASSFFTSTSEFTPLISCTGLISALGGAEC